MARTRLISPKRVFHCDLIKAEKSTVENRTKEPKPHFLYLSNGHPNLVLSFAIKRAALVGRMSMGH